MRILVRRIPGASILSNCVQFRYVSRVATSVFCIKEIIAKEEIISGEHWKPLWCCHLCWEQPIFFSFTTLEQSMRGRTWFSMLHWRCCRSVPNSMFSLHVVITHASNSEYPPFPFCTEIQGSAVAIIYCFLNHDVLEAVGREYRGQSINRSATLGNSSSGLSILVVPRGHGNRRNLGAASLCANSSKRSVCTREQATEVFKVISHSRYDSSICKARSSLMPLTALGTTTARSTCSSDQDFSYTSTTAAGFCERKLFRGLRRTNSV